MPRPQQMSDPIKLPNFLIIGAMKSGTTSLYRYLNLHPSIGMSRDKETDFFIAEKNYRHGLSWYSKQFGDAPINGEASPNYTKERAFPGVPERIALHCPNVKLVYIVRDPIERIKAQFRHLQIMNGKSIDLSEGTKSNEYLHMLDTSLYARQTKFYLDHFERDQILVSDFSEFVSKPNVVLSDICTFLGAEPFDFPSIGSFNESRELLRIPLWILRLGQSRFGKVVLKKGAPHTRDALRRFLPKAGKRQISPFPKELEKQLRDDLMQDVHDFRQLTGMPFSDWSI